MTYSPWSCSHQLLTILVVNTTTRKTLGTKPAAAAKAPARKPLSPRGRGSSAPPVDSDSLLVLFAQNMRLVRQSRALSQEALADLCDLDRTYISSVERKKRNISIRNIQRIAEALTVDPRVLLDPELSKDERWTG